jgi:DNA end-binding protein Ku
VAGRELAAEAFQVIGEAMAAKGLVGIGRVTIASRERLVLVEPHDGGLLMFTMRSTDEVRAAELSAKAKGGADADMVVVAETIIERRRAKFDPAAFRDRYKDALRELVDDKLKGIAHAPSEVAGPSKVINLMDALNRSLAQEAAGAEAKPAPRPGGRKRLLMGGNQRC